MISNCPNCKKPLNFSEAHLTKINGALSTLGVGTTLKIKCPMCTDPIELQPDGTLIEGRYKPATPSSAPGGLEPPAPPDIDWLTQGGFEKEDTIKDIPRVLVLVDPGPDRDKIIGSMVESFFQPVAVDTVAEALEQMRVIQFDSVVLHSKFAGGKLRKSKFHKYMKKMSMVRRRYILYILVGPEFHTLYSLEALSNSANLTINEKDLDHMKTIYKRGKTENDQLFGPYINALKEKGAS
jgi:hypothetical protein